MFLRNKMRMKKLYNTRYLFYWFILFLGLSYSASAQVYYSGGAGGGYASAVISAGTFVLPSDSLPVNLFDVTVFPNPLSSNDVFKARFSGIKEGETVSVVVTNLIGSKLFDEDLEVNNGVVINLPYERLSKGIYLITFRYKTHKISRRFSYIN